MSFTKIVLFLCGLVHSLPVVGVLGNDWLMRLYNPGELNNAVIILLQHRAVMLGILAFICFQGALKPAFRNQAVTLVIVSMISYIFLVGIDNANANLLKVFWIDLALLVVLLLALFVEKIRTPPAIQTQNRGN